MQIKLGFLIMILISTGRAWEYCQSDVQNKLCDTQAHFICDSKNSIKKPFYISKAFLAHAPLTKKIKRAFLNWHNYYRNRTAGGWAKNKSGYFPTAVRMRELIWDSELSYLSHARTKLVAAGSVTCSRTLRFPYVGHNVIVKALNASKPVLEIIALSLREMFNKKSEILNATAMPKNFQGSNYFTAIVNDRASRLGCAVALGDGCIDEEENVYEFCYYTSCTYNYVKEGAIYKIGKPARRCSKWKVGRSKSYINLCANSGQHFVSDP